MYLATTDPDWHYWPYSELAERALRTAGALRERGVDSGDVVGVVLRAGPDLMASMFGALALGAAVSPLAPPTLFANLDEHREHLAALIGAARPRALLTSAEYVSLVASAAVLAGIDCPVWTPEELPADSAAVETRAVDPDAIALVQFTSGSSGRCRGVAVSRRAVEHNVRAVGQWLRMASGDATVSWLPVHHDMGLVGCLLTPVVHGTDLHLMAPEQFVRDPSRYLRRLGCGAQLSAMPAFGLSHIARRVRPEQLAGCDFSAWRALIVGAERVDPDVLTAFTALLAPFGFDQRALLPAYGLAEATLAVSGVALDEDWTSLRIDPRELVPGRPVTLTESGTRLCSSGRPLSGASVRVVDDNGVPLGDDLVGEIVVGGSSVARGYLQAGEHTPGSSSIADGSVRTGDAGFLHAGELYVLGRLGDAMKVRGRSLFAEDVELALARRGIPSLRTAALLGEHAGTPTVVALIEKPEPGWLHTAESELRRLAPEAAAVVVGVPRGGIARTTSGKPRRRLLWTAFVRGEVGENASAAFG